MVCRPASVGLRPAWLNQRFAAELDFMPAAARDLAGPVQRMNE
jgi:hypothetical protein